MSRTLRLVWAYCTTGFTRGLWGRDGAGSESQGGPQGAATVLVGAALQPGQGIAPVQSGKHGRPPVSAAGSARGAPPRRRGPRWRALSGQHLACSASSSFRRMRTSTSDSLARAPDARVARTLSDRMTKTLGRETTLGPCCKVSGPPGHPSSPDELRSQARVIGSRRIRRKNQRSLAKSFSESTHTMFRTAVPAKYVTSSLTRCWRRSSGLYGQPIPASLSQPLPGSPLISNRVPARVIESAFPGLRAESGQGAR